MLKPRSNQRLESQATVPASGNITVIISNMTAGPNWNVKQISIAVSTATLSPSCNTYIGTNAAGVFISNSLTGEADTDSQPNVTIKYGESICAVWTGADVGAVARLTVIYDEEI